MTAYLVSILTFVVFAVLIGFALNIQWGQAGMVNFGLPGFYGIGAYTAALLAIGGADPVSATLAAIAAGAFAAAIVALASARLSEDHLAITTLAFAEAIRLVLLNESWATGGANGIREIPRPFVTWIAPEAYEGAFLGLCLVLVLAVFLMLEILTRAPFGRALRALSDDDVVARALGKDVLALRVKAFAVGGAILGLAGALHAFYFTYIEPGQFAGFVTVYAFMIVIAGGRGSNAGLLIGAATVMLLLEGTRFLRDFLPFVSVQQAAALRLVLIGLGLILLLIFRPDGIRREYRLRVHRGAERRSDRPVAASASTVRSHPEGVLKS